MGERRPMEIILSTNNKFETAVRVLTNSRLT
jgi:hypothetical protein